MVYCDGAIKKCGSCCDYVVGCCNVTLRVERRIELGEDRGGDYLGGLVIMSEDVRSSGRGEELCNFVAKLRDRDEERDFC